MNCEFALTTALFHSQKPKPLNIPVVLFIRDTNALRTFVRKLEKPSLNPYVVVVSEETEAR